MIFYAVGAAVGTLLTEMAARQYLLETDWMQAHVISGEAERELWKFDVLAYIVFSVLGV